MEADSADLAEVDAASGAASAAGGPASAAAPAAAVATAAAAPSPAPAAAAADGGGEGGEEGDGVEFGPALPPPPDALQLLGQYDDSWQQEAPGSPAQEPAPAAEAAAAGVGPEAGAAPHAEADAEPAAANEPGQGAPAAAAAEQQQQQQQQDGRQQEPGAAAPAALGAADGGEPPPPPGLPGASWEIMRKLVRFVQVRPAAARKPACLGLHACMRAEPAGAARRLHAHRPVGHTSNPCCLADTPQHAAPRLPPSTPCGPGFEAHTCAAATRPAPSEGPALAGATRERPPAARPRRAPPAAD